ncbi:MAG: dephospho-CoA kinase [Lachnospiraceae bacterium]|nr:dephospho-CoA kinase [Lachnospiraceae bacterium]
MRRIGITGGVGAGKSQVLGWMKERWGAKLIRTDDVARALMEPGQAGYQQVVEALGTSFLKENGSIDRPALAQIIFQDQTAKAAVDQITHPLVWKAVEEELEAALQEGYPAAVVESAVFDGSSFLLLDELWYVHAPQEVRIRRLMESRGYSRKRCESMIASQFSHQDYQAISSLVIENGGDWEDTKEQINLHMNLLISKENSEN